MPAVWLTLKVPKLIVANPVSHKIAHNKQNEAQTVQRGSLGDDDLSIPELSYGIVLYSSQLP